MRPNTCKTPWRSAGWIALLVVSHLVAFGLRQTTNARANAIATLPVSIPNLVQYSADELYDLAAEAEENSEWEQSLVYLSAYLGKLDESQASSTKVRTELIHLRGALSHARYYYVLGTEAYRDKNLVSRCLADAGVRWSYTVPPRAPSLLPARPPAPSSTRTRAPELLFAEEFNSSPLNRVFQEGLPDAVFRPNSDAFASYEGAPLYSFDTWSGGAKFLRMFNNLNDAQRKGWRTADVYNPGNRAFRLELRFNTRTQSRSMGIDQLLEVWLIDAENQHRHIRVTMLSDGYGANRMFAYTNTLVSKGSERVFSFEDNKWYRLVITGSPNQTIKAAVYDDAGTKELVSLLVGSNLSAFPKGFRLGLSQSVGFPGGRYPTDVGIDWIRLTAVNQ